MWEIKCNNNLNNNTVKVVVVVKVMVAQWFDWPFLKQRVVGLNPGWRLLVFRIKCTNLISN